MPADGLKHEHTARPSTLFWLFLAGSVAGFFLEGIWCVFTKGHWEHHSATVWGPFCIVYGIGAVLVYLLSAVLKGRNLPLQFLLFSASGAAVEYGSSLADVVSLVLLWTRARTLDKAKGPERESAPGPCLVELEMGLEPTTC